MHIHTHMYCHTVFSLVHTYTNMYTQHVKDVQIQIRYVYVHIHMYTRVGTYMIRKIFKICKQQA